MKTTIQLLLFLLFLLMAGCAWGDDARLYTNCNGLWIPIEDCPSPPTAAPALTHAEIADILKRCREFVRDGDEDLNGVSFSYAVYTPLTYRGLAADQVKEAQEDLDRITRETQLRKDIERVLEILDAEKKGKK